MERSDRTATVLGVECFAGSVEQAAADTLVRARSREGGYVCLCSAHGIVLSHHDDAFLEALDRAWLVLPDGFPVAWMARRMGAPRATRIPGTEFMAAVFERGQRIGLRHFLYGASSDVLEQLAAKLTGRFPQANITGSLSPSFTPLNPTEAHDDIQRISVAQPDVVWVGISTPKQDLWMSLYAQLLAPAVVVGVGAAFDFNAGTKRRAPKWMQRTSLEWLHRLASEPRRLTGRYARIIAEFSVRAAVDLVRQRRLI
jgi:N-acetylglucosaminyldiphosphoundecaprenol N-acetyl-beta-D-mannosaminyltransferase